MYVYIYICMYIYIYIYTRVYIRIYTYIGYRYAKIISSATMHQLVDMKRSTAIGIDDPGM